MNKQKYSLEETVDSFKNYSRRVISTILTATIGILPSIYETAHATDRNITAQQDSAKTDDPSVHYIYLVTKNVIIYYTNPKTGEYWNIRYSPRTGFLNLTGEGIQTSVRPTYDRSFNVFLFKNRYALKWKQQGDDLNVDIHGFNLKQERGGGFSITNENSLTNENKKKPLTPGMIDYQEASVNYKTPTSSNSANSSDLSKFSARPIAKPIIISQPVLSYIPKDSAVKFRENSDHSTVYQKLKKTERQPTIPPIYKAPQKPEPSYTYKINEPDTIRKTPNTTSFTLESSVKKVESKEVSNPIKTTIIKSPLPSELLAKTARNYRTNISHRNITQPDYISLTASLEKVNVPQTSFSMDPEILEGEIARERLFNVAIALVNTPPQIKPREMKQPKFAIGVSQSIEVPKIQSLESLIAENNPFQNHSAQIDTTEINQRLAKQFEQKSPKWPYIAGGAVLGLGLALLLNGSDSGKKSSSVTGGETGGTGVK